MENTENKQEILDKRYMQMATIWSENSYCNRRKVGALIVKNKMIFFNDTATTEIYTLSLHDALPI